MAQVRGTAVKVIGFTETTFNTVPGTPDGEVLYFQQFGVGASEDRVSDPTLSGGARGEVRSVADKRDVQGSVPITLAPQSLGFWLKHAIGLPVTSGLGPYTHTFAVANGLPPGALFDLDFGAAITGAGRFVRYSGCRISRAQFSFPATGLQTASFDVRGAGVDATAVAALDATPTDPGHTAWSAKNLALVFDAGATVVKAESASVTWDNDLDDSVFAVGDQGTRSELPEGLAKVSGQIAAFFTSAALMNKALADTDVSLVITLSRGDGLGSAGNESLAITIPSLVFAVKTPAVDGPRGLKFTSDFTAHRTSGELAVTAVLKNARATI